MNQSFDLDAVEHFTVGAIGEPGSRLFVIQFKQDRTIATFKVEKQQVAALCDYLGELLADAARPGHLPEDLELLAPIEIDWAVGAMAATYDDEIDRVLLVIEEVEAGAEATDPDLPPSIATARMIVSREQAAAVAIHGTTLVQAGRPPCPLCGHPLDPKGHACPKTNGHRPPSV